MSETLVISASPSETSRTSALAQHVSAQLQQFGLRSSVIEVRKLPAEDLILARTSAPPIAAALARVASATSIVVTSPVYKAAYCGLLKVFLDLFPQFGLRGKIVFPLLTGGTPAHVLAIDYALRPVLASMDPFHVLGGLFVLDKQIEISSTGKLQLASEVSAKLDASLLTFNSAHRRSVYADSTDPNTIGGGAVRDQICSSRAF